MNKKFVIRSFSFSLFFMSMLFVLTTGCEDIPSEVIDPGVNIQEASVKNIIVKNNFNYSAQDSSIIIVGEYIGAKTPQYSIKSPVAIAELNNQIHLFDDGDLANNGDSVALDNKFSSRVYFKKSYPSGKYIVNFFNDAGHKKIAESAINYFNGEEGFIPEISDLQIPDTARQNVSFTFSLLAIDQNLPNDSLTVYYSLFRPNGQIVTNSQGISKFPLFDDGDTAGNGDETASDNRYTVRLAFPSSFETGLWKFQFNAKDLTNKISNTLSHNLEVIQ